LLHGPRRHERRREAAARREPHRRRPQAVRVRRQRRAGDPHLRRRPRPSGRHARARHLGAARYRREAPGVQRRLRRPQPRRRRRPNRMSTGLASQRVTNAHPRQRGEPFVEGLQDLRRIRGAALRRWRASLASRRFGGVANILLVGDSMSEHYGATSEYNRWPFLFRAAIQRMFRLGGVGWIPAKHTSGWLYTTNPDGKNAWTLTGLGDNNDYGFGLGRHNAYLAQAGTATITVDTDRFFLFFTTGGGSGTVTTIDVDPGTAFAKTTTVNTNQAWGQSGFLFDSNTAFGPLPLGTHVVKVTATTGATFFDGGFFCYTDGIAGVHLWECDHAGFTSMEFDGASDTHSYWADFMW